MNNYPFCQWCQCKPCECGKRVFASTSSTDELSMSERSGESRHSAERREVLACRIAGAIDRWLEQDDPRPLMTKVISEELANNTDE